MEVWKIKINITSYLICLMKKVKHFKWKVLQGEKYNFDKSSEVQLKIYSLVVDTKSTRALNKL